MASLTKIRRRPKETAKSIAKRLGMSEKSTKRLEAQANASRPRRDGTIIDT